ncbi:hypothetical protein [Nesterenkonia jeotgali]|uniref:Uncharacterized protein n=1 Tax=Nesterenkonia jeotgali TaxID=317018 RepID=A0A0W8IJU1_9MICC|nr:hypothetical protein [Nesterenkonia jeotgali]KUG59888.1 hypothetical protein AVL63_12650 [Nesterenkonia jeotgali]
MTPTIPSKTTPERSVETTRTRARGALALVAMTPLLLLGCMAEEDPSTGNETSEAPEAPGSQAPESSQPSGTPDSGETETPEEDAPSEDPGEIPSPEGPSGELQDPDSLDLERTEELGAYFSEEEACMSVGSMIDGLESDMNSGIEEQDVLDDIYSAVEQNYILVPEELREPLRNILTLLDTDVETLDEESVLVAAEPVAGWLTVEFCDGEYHNQTPGDDA